LLACRLLRPLAVLVLQREQTRGDSASSNRNTLERPQSCIAAAELSILESSGRVIFLQPAARGGSATQPNSAVLAELESRSPGRQIGLGRCTVDKSTFTELKSPPRSRSAG